MSSSNLFKNKVTYKLFTYKTYKADLALNNSQELICHETPTDWPTNSPDDCVIYMKLSVTDFESSWFRYFRF